MTVFLHARISTLGDDDITDKSDSIHCDKSPLTKTQSDTNLCDGDSNMPNVVSPKETECKT